MWHQHESLQWIGDFHFYLGSWVQLMMLLLMIMRGVRFWFWNGVIACYLYPRFSVQSESSRREGEGIGRRMALIFTVYDT
jgi:hypothetical protein